MLAHLYTLLLSLMSHRGFWIMFILVGLLIFWVDRDERA